MMMMCSTITKPVDFLLLGDSHAGAIGKAATRRGLAFVGGPLGSGRDFTADCCDFTGEGCRFHRDEVESLVAGFLAEIGTPSLYTLRVPLVATFGLCCHVYAAWENWLGFQDQAGQFPPDFLESQFFAEVIAEMARGALGFYTGLQARGVAVYAVLPPQRVPEIADPRVFFAAQAALITALERAKIPIIDVRARACAPDGRQSAPYCEPQDPLHGSEAFGDLILDALAPILAARVSAPAHSREQ